MGRSQRRKGSAYEREVAKRFSEALGVEVKRHIGQARDGGEDIQAPGLSIECKRRARIATVSGWMEQAVTAATRRAPGSMPVVVARQDHGESLAILRLDDLLALLRAAPQ